MSTVKATGAEVKDNWLPSIEVLGRLDVETGDLRIAAYHHVTSSDPADRATVEASIAAQITAINATMAAYEPLVSSPEEQALGDEFTSAWTAYLAAQSAALDLSRQNLTDQANAAILATKDDFDNVGNILDRAKQLNHDGAVAAAKVADDTYSSARTTVIVIPAVAVLVGALLAWKIASEIGKRLATTAGCSRRSSPRSRPS